MKILIIDDSLVMRSMIKKNLHDHGFQDVYEAEDGNEGVNKYKLFKPDLVTMDITMPVMDGIAAIQAIKAYDSAARIIVISAMGQKQKIAEAVKAGASDFIVKPYETEQLAERIKKILAVQ